MWKRVCRGNWRFGEGVTNCARRSAICRIYPQLICLIRYVMLTKGSARTQPHSQAPLGARLAEHDAVVLVGPEVGQQFSLEFGRVDLANALGRSQSHWAFENDLERGHRARLWCRNSTYAAGRMPALQGVSCFQGVRQRTGMRDRFESRWCGGGPCGRPPCGPKPSACLPYGFRRQGVGPHAATRVAPTHSGLDRAPEHFA